MLKYFSLALAICSTMAWGQSTLEEWAQENGTPAAGSAAPRASAQVVRGGLITYPDRASFDSQFPASSQTCEDFETNQFNDGAIIGFPAPLDASTDNSVFAAGSITPGISVYDDPLNDAGGGSVSGLVAIGAGAFSTPSDLVAANTFIDSYVMALSPARQDIAFDVYSFTVGGTATVTFYDASDTQIGQVSVGASPSAGGFVGVSSPVGIARIDVYSVDGSGADEAEGIDDFCYADAPPPPPQEVPVLGTAGAAVLVMLFFLGTFLIGRRQ
jgi:hypothetical protein